MWHLLKSRPELAHLIGEKANPGVSRPASDADGDCVCGDRLKEPLHE